MSKHCSRTAIALLLTGTVLGVPLVAAAQLSPSTVDPGQLQRRLKEPRSWHPATTITIPGTEDEGLKSASEEKVFTLGSVALDGSTVYSAEDFAEQYSDFVGKAVSFADLRRIASRMTNKYRADGYILSRVIVPPQKVGSGAVHFKAIEGRIESVEFEGDIKGDKELLDAYAAKIVASKPINASKLERYMLLIDDLPGVTARSVIRPSRKTPQAATLVITLDHKMIEGDVSVDNRGNRFLGPEQLGAVLAINSGMGMYDRNTFRGIASADFDELFYGEFTHESQLGTEGTRLNVRAATTYTNPGGRLEPLDIEGSSHLFEASVMYPYLRSREENLDFYGGFRIQNTQTDILSTNLFEDRVRVASAGFQYDNTDNLDGVNQLDASLSQGIDGLGATHDGAGRSRVSGEHSFTRFNATLTRIQNIDDEFSFYLSADGQYTSDSLLTSEQFAIGGSRFGRAYDGSEITGDNGLAGLVELRYAGFPSGGWFESYQPYVFYDIGKVWTNVPAVGEQNHESLASTGLGVRFNLINDFSGEAQLAVPLTHQVASERDEDARFFFNLLKRF